MKINHGELYEMARVGYMGDYEVYVNTDDPGIIPHFHNNSNVDVDLSYDINGNLVIPDYTNIEE